MSSSRATGTAVAGTQLYTSSCGLPGFVSIQSQTVSMIYIQALFMILLSTHCLIRPYQSTSQTLLFSAMLTFFLLLCSQRQIKSEYNHVNSCTSAHSHTGHQSLVCGCVSSKMWCMQISLSQTDQKRAAAISFNSNREYYEERLPSLPSVPCSTGGASS